MLFLTDKGIKSIKENYDLAIQTTGFLIGMFGYDLDDDSFKEFHNMLTNWEQSMVNKCYDIGRLCANMLKISDMHKQYGNNKLLAPMLQATFVAMQAEGDNIVNALGEENTEDCEFFEYPLPFDFEIGKDLESILLGCSASNSIFMEMAICVYFKKEPNTTEEFQYGTSWTLQGTQKESVKDLIYYAWKEYTEHVKEKGEQ
jgi:hypothetical protein